MFPIWKLPDFPKGLRPPFSFALSDLDFQRVWLGLVIEIKPTLILAEFQFYVKPTYPTYVKSGYPEGKYVPLSQNLDQIKLNHSTA